MALKFPDTEGVAYSLANAEIQLGTSIFTAIANIATSQPIEEGVVYGAAAEPLQRTRGQLQIGDGTIEFSAVEEGFRFITELGDGWQEKTWTLTYTLTRPGADSLKVECFGCRILDCELDHSNDSDALGASLPFSFMNRLINGKSSLVNQRL